MNNGERRTVDWIEGHAPERNQISECGTCADLFDKGLESKNPESINEVAIAFLRHVINNHTPELLAVLAERYVPIFLNKRALR